MTQESNLDKALRLAAEAYAKGLHGKVKIETTNKEVKEGKK